MIRRDLARSVSCTNIEYGTAVWKGACRALALPVTGTRGAGPSALEPPNSRQLVKALIAVRSSSSAPCVRHHSIHDCSMT